MQNTTPSQNPIIKSKRCPKLHSKETSQMLCILYWYAFFKWWSKIWKLASVYENSQTRQLCFSCLGWHRVSDCQSRSNCKTRHHTSICNIRDTENAQSTSTCSSTLKIRNIKCIPPHTEINQMCYCYMHVTVVAPFKYGQLTTDANILLDEGAQRSFISNNLAEKL